MSRCVPLCDCPCPKCGALLCEDYDEHGEQITCGHCHATHSHDELLDAHESLDAELRNDAEQCRFEVLVALLRKHLPCVQSEDLLRIADGIGEAIRLRGATARDVELAFLFHGQVLAQGESRECCQMRQRETE